MTLTLSQYTKVALWRGQRSSKRRLRIQQDLETKSATPWYSSLALDLDKVGCRLEDQESKLSPRNIQ